MSRNRKTVLSSLALAALASIAVVSCNDRTPTAPTNKSVSGPQKQVSVPFNSAGQCMEQDIASLSDANNTTPSCTANDIRVASATVTAINGQPYNAGTDGPIQCVPNAPITLTITANLEATSTEDREDIGAWIATDGGTARTGACNHYNLVDGSVNTINTDGDFCAGMSAKGDPNPQAHLELGTITLPCNVVAGKLHVGSCLTWKVPGQNEACPTGFDPSDLTYTANDFRQATLPGTPAKCNCEGFDIPVQAVGSLTIIKDAVPNSAQNFAYTTSGTGMSNFSLDDDADPTLSNTQTFSNLVNDGSSRSVTEGAVTGWDLTSINCTGATLSTVTPNVASRSVSVTLRAGETVSCTFTNTQRAILRIAKATQPSGSLQSFTFTPTGYNSGNTFNLTDGQSFSSGYVLAASYSAAETVPSGWDLTSRACVLTGTATTHAYTSITNGVTVTLAPGEDVTCTFTNTQRGSITIVKDDQNPATDAQDFSYTASGTGVSPTSFSLDDDADPTLSNSQGFSNLVPLASGGSRSFVEGANSNWALTAINCVSSLGTSTYSVNTSTRTATVSSLGANDNVTCTFVNKRRARLTVDKVVVGGGTQLFDFSLNPGSVSFSLADATTPYTTGFTLAPNTYRSCELALAVAWAATATVDGQSQTLINPDFPQDVGNRCVDVAVGYGDDKLIVWTNTPPPGGNARTIGYWKNWSSCTGGKQYVKAQQRNELDKTLDFYLPVSKGLYPIGDVAGPLSCPQGVNLLDKRDMNSGQKMASDPAYNMAAQFVAAKLNYLAGAKQCPLATQAIANGQTLLDAINFVGYGAYKASMTAAQISAANSLATTLDSYNNNTLSCP